MKEIIHEDGTNVATRNVVSNRELYLIIRSAFFGGEKIVSECKAMS